MLKNCFEGELNEVQTIGVTSKKNITIGKGNKTMLFVNIIAYEIK